MLSQRKQIIKKYVNKEQNHPLTTVTLLTKAEDQFLAVAVSSIISRYLFLENLKNYLKNQVSRYPVEQEIYLTKLQHKLSKVRELML